MISLESSASTKVMVIMWSIEVALVLVTLVGLLTIGKRFEKI